jgi:hypothetical protein
LLHAPLTVPHDRLKVTGVDLMVTWDGEACVASVELDGEPFGTLENEGHGGPTTFHPTGTGEDASGRYRERRETWEAYVRACAYSDEQVARWHDKPHMQTFAMQEEHVADLLIQEYDDARFVAEQMTGHRVCLRVFSTTTGFRSEIRGGEMRLRTYSGGMDDELRAKVSGLRESYPMAGDVWQVWTGQTWQDLTNPILDEDEAEGS